MNKIIEIKLSELPMKEITEFKNFQGNLKKLSEANAKKLKNSLIKRGFNTPVFIWKGHDYILNGHQRIFVLREMLKDGYSLMKSGIETTKIPYIEIEAKDKKEAGELILQFDSKYGDTTKEGLQDFITDFELDIPDLKFNMNLSVNLDKVEIALPKTEEESNCVDKLGSLVVECPECHYKFKRSTR